MISAGITHSRLWSLRMGSRQRHGLRVFKEHDDLMSATRYACMMLRFAETPNRPKLNLGNTARTRNCVAT
jgi:hypothetical protein